MTGRSLRFHWSELGWVNPVVVRERAHNPKVAGSNPVVCENSAHGATRPHGSRTFMKRPVNLPERSRERPVLLDRSPVSARPSICKGPRERVTRFGRRQAPLLVQRGWLPLLYALCLARFGAGARYDPKEEQRSLKHGSQKRPGSTTRLLLQLDDLPVNSYAAVRLVVPVVSLRPGRSRAG